MAGVVVHCGGGACRLLPSTTARHKGDSAGEDKLRSWCTHVMPYNAWAIDECDRPREILCDKNKDTCIGLAGNTERLCALAKDINSEKTRRYAVAVDGALLCRMELIRTSWRCCRLDGTANERWKIWRISVIKMEKCACRVPC